NPRFAAIPAPVTTAVLTNSLRDFIASPPVVSACTLRPRLPHAAPFYTLFPAFLRFFSVLPAMRRSTSIPRRTRESSHLARPSLQAIAIRRATLPRPQEPPPPILDSPGTPCSESPTCQTRSKPALQSSPRKNAAPPQSLPPRS